MCPLVPCFTTFMIALHRAVFSGYLFRYRTYILRKGTWKAMPISFTFSSKIIWLNALAFSMTVGMMSLFTPLCCFPEEISNVFWVTVTSWTMAMSLLTIAKLLGVQDIGGAGSIDDNLQGIVVLLMVYTHHKYRGISRWIWWPFWSCSLGKCQPSSGSIRT